MQVESCEHAVNFARHCTHLNIPHTIKLHAKKRINKYEIEYNCSTITYDKKKSN